MNTTLDFSDAETAVQIMSPPPTRYVAKNVFVLDDFIPSNGIIRLDLPENTVSHHKILLAARSNPAFEVDTGTTKSFFTCALLSVQVPF